MQVGEDVLTDDNLFLIADYGITASKLFYRYKEKSQFRTTVPTLKSSGKIPYIPWGHVPPVTSYI